MADARKIVLKALLEIRQKSAYSNLTLNRFLKDNDITLTDKSLITAIFYGVLDRTITLDYVLSSFIKTPLKKVSPLSLEALRCALYQIMFMDKIPNSAAVNESVRIVKSSKERYNAAFVNGVLRNILRSEIKLPLEDDAKGISIKYSCPMWIVESFINDYGKENAINLLSHSLKNPPITLRVNALRTDTDSLIALLESSGVSSHSCQQENAVNITGGIDVRSNTAYKKGLFHIQDLASQAAVEILSPKTDERVLDVCSAPGGKAFTMAQYMKNSGEIIACDLYESRVKLIAEGAKRLGIDIIKPQVADATVYNGGFGQFDAILCDVVCSGLGVIRRKPEIKYKSLEEYEDITIIQSAILENTARYLCSGGRLLYSTCTLRRCENEGVVYAFLDKNSDYELKYEHTFMPHIDGTDGFYCALLQKSG